MLHVHADKHGMFWHWVTRMLTIRPKMTCPLQRISLHCRLSVQSQSLTAWSYVRRWPGPSPIERRWWEKRQWPKYWRSILVSPSTRRYAILYLYMHAVERRYIKLR